MKKILTLLALVLIAACSVIAMTACENTDWGEGDGDPSLLEYKLSDDGTYYSVAGIGDYVGTHLVIPEEYNGLPVREIGSDAFTWDNTGEKENDEQLLLLKIVTIPDSITTVGELAFSRSKVEKIYLGRGVSNEYWIPFLYVKELNEVRVNKDNQYFMSKDGVLYSKDGSVLIKYPAKKRGKTFRIPREVETIRRKAFAFTENLKKVKMAKSVTEIENSAFLNSSLEKIKIGNGVETIEGSVFDGCENLKKVKIGKNVAIIGSYVFSGTAIKKIKIPKTVTSMQGAFSGCKHLKKVVLESGLKEVSRDAFINCESLERIIIPKSVKTIGARAFDGCENLSKLYYEGNEDEWANVELVTSFYDAFWGGMKYDQPIFSDNTQIYTYSKKRPSGDGNYWRYVFWMPAVWKS